MSRVREALKNGVVRRDALVLNGVSVGYGTDAILSEVNLTIHPGEVYGLIGPNGSGKTTLVKGITRRAPILSGHVYYGETNLETLSVRERAKIVSVVPQAAGLPDGYSVFDVVAMGRTAYSGWFGQLSKTDRTAVNNALRYTGLTTYARKNSAHLSGGEQQRVLIARAIAQETPVLILDEPTTYLDLYYQVNLLDLIRAYCTERSVAVLLILHDLNHAARYTDRIMILNEGKVVDSGATVDVLDEARLSEVYRVKLERIERNGHGPDIFMPHCER